jgi:hypothetical protein
MLSIRLSSALSSLLLCFLYRYSLRYNLRFFSLFFSRICFLTRLGLEVLPLTPFAPLFLLVHGIHYFFFIRCLPPLFSLFSLFFCRGPFSFLHSVLHCFLLVPLLSPRSLFLLRFLRFLSRTLRVLLSNPMFRPFLLLVSAILFLFSCCPPPCFLGIPGCLVLFFCWRIDARCLCGSMLQVSRLSSVFVFLASILCSL